MTPDTDKIKKLPKWAQSLIRELLANAHTPRWRNPREINVEAEAKKIGFGDVRPAYTFNAHAKRVDHGCFSRISHSTRTHEETTSQGLGGPWYDSDRDAARALILELDRLHRKAVAEIAVRHGLLCKEQA